MSNLLPTDTIRNLKRTYMLRAASAACLLLFMAGLISTLALTPAYLVAKTKKDTLAYEIEALSGDGVGSSASPSLADARAAIKLIEYIDARADIVSRAVSVALGEQPSGITLSRVAYVQQGGEDVLSISGIYATKDVLTSYVNDLRATGAFAEVTIPLSALANTTNGSFTLTLRPPQ